MPRPSDARLRLSRLQPLLSAHDILEIYQVRECLESLAARIAAEQIPSEQLAALTHELAFSEQCATEGHHNEILESDIRFHKLIISATQNQRLAAILTTLDDQMYRIRLTLPRSAGWIEETLAEHRAIVERITTRDADGAARAMGTHLRSF
ncbi:FCD domain-containing protein [Candidatus Chloroploca sp. M-50]|uniref:FCD domain-containing protein n=1 Tax=Candidatus Chloroploca mongolica TaxID=2528176 RepID=A0ABS4DGD3_9CHLR|nr:FCD domain-containing protein [Candidatus Chloroploca mongolica]MBP1468434.1 FCD domain-containing protein [Candidatus Chloroploca mongolica]